MSDADVLRPVFLAAAVMALTACASSGGPSIRFSPVLPASSLMAWYVEDDGQGHAGYACVDGALAFPPPEGGGLFPSLDALAAAIRGADLVHPVILNGFRGVLPEGWKVRALTRTELDTLQPALQRD